MYAPGWYHAQGDPASTQRYWDGQHWQGQPTTQPGSDGVIYYAAADARENGNVATRTATMNPSAQAGVGDVAYVARPRAASWPAHTASIRKRFPGGLRALAILVTVLKAVPLAVETAGGVHFLAEISEADESGLRPITRLGTESGGAMIAGFIIVLLAFTLAGARVFYLQVRNAVQGEARRLVGISLLLFLVDLFFVVVSWMATLDGEPLPRTLFITSVASLQLCVVLWAALVARKS